MGTPLRPVHPSAGGAGLTPSASRRRERGRRRDAVRSAPAADRATPVRPEPGETEHGATTIQAQTGSTGRAAERRRRWRASWPAMNTRRGPGAITVWVAAKAHPQGTAPAVDEPSAEVDQPRW